MHEDRNERELGGSSVNMRAQSGSDSHLQTYTFTKEKKKKSRKQDQQILSRTLMSTMRRAVLYCTTSPDEKEKEKVCGCEEEMRCGMGNKGIISLMKDGEFDPYLSSIFVLI